MIFRGLGRGRYALQTAVVPSFARWYSWTSLEGRLETFPFGNLQQGGVPRPHQHAKSTRIARFRGGWNEGGLVTRDFYTTVGEKNHVSFFFLDLLPNSRLDSSLLKTRNLLGVFVGNNIFLRGLGPTSVLYMFSVEGGVGSDEDAKCTQNGSAPRKGHIPCKMRIFSESKGQKKKNTISNQ